MNEKVTEDADMPREPARDSAFGSTRSLQKRQRILATARELLFSQGFDITSMDDIAREAGVSKPTLYAYFQNKERLFGEVVHAERAALAGAMFTIDLENRDVRAVLGQIGRAVVRVVTSPWAVMAFRAVIAIGKRMPELGSDYYEEGPRLVVRRLAAYLARQAELGTLDIDDPELAAAQFLDMAQTTMARPLLFGADGPPDQARVDYVVDSAVRVFLAAYEKRSK